MVALPSLLDNDLYKFTMQQAVLALYPETQVTYKFKDRGRRPFTPKALYELQKEIHMMQSDALQDDEFDFLKEKCPFLTPQYLEYLKNFRFDPNQVEVHLDEDNILQLEIEGSWHSTILWEVPLMALISEIYFKYVETNWNNDGQEEKLKEKAEALQALNRPWACFSTRRRRDYHSQDRVVRIHKEYSNFSGTSNVHFAMKYGVKPIGTQAHEWIMGNSVLCGLRHANKYSMKAWNKVFKGRLGIALTDTYGSDSFFQDFDGELARMYDGVRHDSGDPLEFADKVIKHYNSLGIPSNTKTIVFSDGLNVEEATKISDHVNGRIKIAFGIGTNFSNDYDGSPAMNMVIKLRTVEGIPVVKLSDDKGKATGDQDAVRVAKWTFFGDKL